MERKHEELYASTKSLAVHRWRIGKFIEPYATRPSLSQHLVSQASKGTYSMILIHIEAGLASRLESGMKDKNLRSTPKKYVETSAYPAEYKTRALYGGTPTTWPTT